MHLFHIPQHTTQNINVRISILNGALWDMEQAHYGICEKDLFLDHIVFLHWKNASKEFFTDWMLANAHNFNRNSRVNIICIYVNSKFARVPWDKTENINHVLTANWLYVTPSSINQNELKNFKYHGNAIPHILLMKLYALSNESHIFMFRYGFMIV